MATELAPPVLLDIADTATEQLEAELVAHAAWEAAGMARMLQVLAEFDRREAWASWQCQSAQQWLGWKCGLGYVAATERLRVARRLPELPLISAAFTGGLVSWSKVRELTRVATPRTEADLLNIALYGTAAQVARVVGALRKITRKQAVRQLADREFRWHTDDDGAVVISVRLPADQAMRVVAQVQAATVVEKGVPRARSAADAFVRLVTGDHTASRQRAITHTIVHVDATGARFEDGPPIAHEIAECLACDGPVTTVTDSPQGPVEIDRRRAPSRRQRRWLALRHPTCQFDGCHHAGGFEAHHVVEHRRGGKTRVSNLVRLCWFHHRMVHLHGLLLTLHPDRTLEVRFPDGKLVNRDLPTAAFFVEAPARPDDIGGRWCGDRLDLDHALTNLLANA
jgi:Domain of unknown function (DUF222)